MKLEICKCDDCPFFEPNESLRNGFYSTGTYNPFCNHPNPIELEQNVSRENIGETLPTNCPLKTPLTLKIKE